MPAKNGVPADVPPVGTMVPVCTIRYGSWTPDAVKATSGTNRALTFGTPGPACQDGLEKTLLAPPPVAVQKMPRCRIVPGNFRNVRQRRTQIGPFLVRPVIAIAFRECCSAHSGHLGHACRCVDLRSAEAEFVAHLALARSSARVARGGDPSHSLSNRLLCDSSRYPCQSSTEPVSQTPKLMLSTGATFF